MRLLICICFSLLVGALHAQVTSTPDGIFSVPFAKGCNNYQVQVSSADCGVSKSCSINYGEAGDNSFVTLAPDQPQNYTHTYTQPGTYNIRVVNGARQDALNITVVDNIKPGFQVANCAVGNTVSLDILDNNYDKYQIDFGEGPLPPPTTSKINIQHTYATNTTKTVKVRGVNNNAADNCSDSVQTLIITPALTAPTISVAEVASATSIDLEFAVAQNVQYKLEGKPNNTTQFQPIRNLYNENTFTVTSLKTDVNYYCFHLGAVDACNRTNPTIAYSGTVCTSILDLEIENNQNVASWTTTYSEGTLASLDLEVENENLNSTNSYSVTSTEMSANEKIDANVTCGTEYCYRLVMNYGTNSKSYSNQKCGVAISTDKPNPIQEVASIISGSSVELDWQQPAGFTADIYTVTRHAKSSTRFTTPETTYTDTGYDPESPWCYSISYNDKCGNSSDDGSSVCPLLLQAKVNDDNHVSLTWDGYTGYSSGVQEYTIEKYNSNGVLLATYTTNGTSYLDESEDLLIQSYVYVVKATPNTSGLPESVSNTVEVIKNPNLFYPTAFTPNGDTQNDLFNVFGQYITEFEMSIFNRWGELMFTTTDISTGWDGTFKGTAMPEGTYTFVAKITDLAGRNFKRSGSVLLLRKK